MKTPPKKSKAAPSRVVSAQVKRKRPVVREVVEVDDDEFEEEEEPEVVEVDTDDDDEPEETSGGAYKRKEVKGSAKGFFDSISDTIKNAGETAKRYTTIGVSHAEIEKLRFELRGAYAALGEVAMRCWDDACDLGLSSKDPAVSQAIKRVREVRRRIREKEAKIASLKKDNAVD